MAFSDDIVLTFTFPPVHMSPQMSFNNMTRRERFCPTRTSSQGPEKICTSWKDEQLVQKQESGPSPVTAAFGESDHDASDEQLPPRVPQEAESRHQEGGKYGGREVQTKITECKTLLQSLKQFTFWKHFYVS